MNKQIRIIIILCFLCVVAGFEENQENTKVLIDGICCCKQYLNPELVCVRKSSRAKKKKKVSKRDKAIAESFKKSTPIFLRSHQDSFRNDYFSPSGSAWNPYDQDSFSLQQVKEVLALKKTKLNGTSFGGSKHEKSGRQGEVVQLQDLISNGKETEIRRSAVDRLGKIGGIQEASFLIFASQTETDTSVLRAMIKSLGNIMQETLTIGKSITDSRTIEIQV